MGACVPAKENAVLKRSKSFAVRCVRLYQHLQKKNEFVLAKQMMKAGTSIGANVHEAVQAQSRKDFLSKMQIALKEASETEYWLELLYETEYLSDKEYKSMQEDCGELNKLLISIVKSVKNV